MPSARSASGALDNGDSQPWDILGSVEQLEFYHKLQQSSLQMKCDFTNDERLLPHMGPLKRLDIPF